MIWPAPVFANADSCFASSSLTWPSFAPAFRSSTELLFYQTNRFTLRQRQYKFFVPVGWGMRHELFSVSEGSGAERERLTKRVFCWRKDTKEKSRELVPGV